MSTNGYQAWIGVPEQTRKGKTHLAVCVTICSVARSGQQETFVQRRLRERREELGYTQPELISAAGIRPGSVQRLEQGQSERLQPGNELALARALRWEDGWLTKLRNGQEPEERIDTEEVTTLPPQLASIISLARSLDEPTQQKGLNAALRCFVEATASE